MGLHADVRADAPASTRFASAVARAERSCPLKADEAKVLLTTAAWSQVMSMLPIAWRVARAMASIVVSRVRSSTSARCDSKNLLADSICASNVSAGRAETLWGLAEQIMRVFVAGRVLVA